MLGTLRLVGALALGGTLVFSLGCGDPQTSFGRADAEQAQETPDDDPITPDAPIEDDEGDLSEGGFEPGGDDEPEQDPPPGDVPILCSGAAGELTLLSLGTVAAEVSIGPNTHIEGSVGAGHWVTKGPHAIVSGQVIFPVDAEVLGDANAFANAAATTEPHKLQSTLGAELIDVGNHSWAIEVGEVNVPDGGTLEISGGLEGKLMIHVSGSFHFGVGSELKLSGELTPADVLFYLDGPSNTEDRVEGGSSFNGATILAPYRTVLLGSKNNAPNNGLSFAGAVIAETVKAAPSSTIVGDTFGKCPW